MKNHLYKAALAAAVGLAGASAAHAQIANNDLLLGFTSPNAASVGGTQYDYIIDLGQLLGASAEQVTLSGSQYDASTFTTDLGSAVTGGSAYAGIFGGTSGSSADVLISGTSTPATGTANNYKLAAEIPSGVTLGAVAQGGNSVYNLISEGPGKNGANSSSFAQYLGTSPLETVTTAEGTGGTVMDLSVYEGNVTGGLHPTAGAFTDEGYVSVLFGSNGGIEAVAWDEAATPTAVPEPATYGIFGGIGVLLLGLRRQLTGKLV